MRLRTAEFDKVVEPLGYITDEQKATFVGVSQATMWRVRKGSTPSAGFIAAVRLALPRLPYERLFEETGHEVEEVSA